MAPAAATLAARMTRNSLSAIPTFIARASCVARGPGSTAQGRLYVEVHRFFTVRRLSFAPYEPRRANYSLQPAAARRDLHALRQRLTPRADRPPGNPGRDDRPKTDSSRLAQSATRSRARRKKKMLNGLWRNADFVRLWTSLTITHFGGQITFLALPLTAALLLDATPFEMGVLTALESVPFALFGLFVGVLVGRAPKRPIIG